MAITTYDELKTAIADFLNRDDLTSTIPTFIDLAEAALNRDLRHWRNENRAIAPVNSRYSALPSDFVEPIRMELSDDKTKVSLMSHYEMQTQREASNDKQGKPLFYNITQGEIEFSQRQTRHTIWRCTTMGKSQRSLQATQRTRF